MAEGLPPPPPKLPEVVPNRGRFSVESIFSDDQQRSLFIPEDSGAFEPFLVTMAVDNRDSNKRVERAGKSG